MEQSRRSYEREMLNLDNQIDTLTETVARNERLIAERAISEKEYADRKRDLQHQINLRELAIEGRVIEEELQKINLEGQRTAVERMQRNLDIAHRSIEDLTVKAPIDGQLTALDVELGKSVSGELGKIDVVNDYKLSVLIDEYYINDVQRGHYGEIKIDDSTHKLVVTKIYPQIDQNQFEVDMEFEGPQPTNLRRGQTLQLRLRMGGDTQSLLVDRGSFFQETAGNWVFVLNDEGDAVRRDIEIGRRNSDYFEVLSGLAPGDQVIVSDYSSFSDVERIQFN
jgi:HlyD family secretion protein